MAEDFGADDGVLDEVLRHAAADHQQAGGARLDLDVGQLAEIGDRIERYVVTAALHRIDLMLHQPETGRAVGERGAEDRHVMHIRSEEHKYELQSLLRISYAVLCLKNTNL